MSLSVIAAFPATGKTHLAERHPEIVDSDSSSYSWKWTSFETRERHPDWPTNYLQHIDAALKEDKAVLVSTHEEVRTALVMGHVPFVLIYPRADLRHEYMQRMADRGSPGGLIQVVHDRWFGWMQSLRSQEGCAHVVLGPGEFLRWPL